jgi:hypothetical protein
MKPLPNLLLDITGDQGSDDPGQISGKSLDHDPNLQPAGEANSAVYFRN